MCRIHGRDAVKRVRPLARSGYLEIVNRAARATAGRAGALRLLQRPMERAIEETLTLVRDPFCVDAP